MSLLATGALIVERLKTSCPAARGNVFSARDLADIDESKQITPALHVMLYDYRPVATRAGSAKWEETWIVVAVVKHAARTDRPLALIDEGAALVDQVVAALSGWHPGRSVAVPITLSEGPRPGFSETHAYFPLAFTAVVFSQNQNKRPAP
jgi:hypothetical protein